MFGRVSIVHGTVLLFLILQSLFPSCHHKPKNVTFFDLAGGPAPAPAPEPESEAAPEPEVKIKPEPKPVPKPEPKPEKKLSPKPIETNAPPKKVETNAPPKKVETKKPAVTNTPTKPKTEAEKLEERLAEVRKGGKPVKASKTQPGAPVAKSRLDYSGLQAALNSGAAGSSSGTGSGGSSSGFGSGSGGMYSPFAGYYDSIKQRMYGVWNQPAGAPIGLTATAVIRVEKNGTVSRKAITARSGNMLFDQSVQSALNATLQLPAPPDELAGQDIEIVFELAD
ncbi:MAG: TonB C-terminal domain-containing protein [Verrucomicrobia bacterium]|nr:TonB C-terminal domain-containing protein [Verrucomicrobiota bacterium]